MRRQSKSGWRVAHFVRSIGQIERQAKSTDAHSVAGADFRVAAANNIFSRLLVNEDRMKF